MRNDDTDELCVDYNYLVRGRKLDPESAAMRQYDASFILASTPLMLLSRHIRQRVGEIETTVSELEILLAQMYSAKRREQKQRGHSQQRASPSMKLLDTLSSQNDIITAQTRNLDLLQKQVCHSTHSQSLLLPTCVA